MPNFMSWSSEWCSRAPAEQLLQGGPALAPLHLAELREALPGLLDGDRDEPAVLTLLRPLELVLDIAQVELLLRHDAFQHLTVLATIQDAEVRFELRVGQALDGVNRRERDDAPDVGRELLEELTIAPKFLGAAREVRLHLRRHRLGLDPETVDPVGEDLGMPLLVAVVDLHRVVQIGRAHV